MRGQPASLHEVLVRDGAGADVDETQSSIVLFLLILHGADPLSSVIPFLSFLGDSSHWMRHPEPSVLIFAVGALGLHILLLGLTGQVSLGHAFFMGVGAYTAAVPGRRVLGKATIGFESPDVDLAPSGWNRCCAHRCPRGPDRQCVCAVSIWRSCHGWAWSSSVSPPVAQHLGHHRNVTGSVRQLA